MIDDSKSSGDALTLEALRQGLRLRADLAAWFLKAIGKAEGLQGHSVVDLWVLFCLHANQDTSKKVARPCESSTLHGWKLKQEGMPRWDRKGKTKKEKKVHDSIWSVGGGK